ncbi:hypothetical protein FC52_GL001064 [Lactobacillus pasteurii DSM 23907 = CRBIP 24.76]|uniref:ORF107 n=1 Tax=Lactobacillus pasteurii DSM 23907 = CRBIP 24.76 TaxID=1423790 RepID=I7KLN0_9LACO|nr:phage holin [Lactobacillus pasteurii]KRK07204.1 hypothetical protein FC52_GL001064 [Lactobacillus pasteurii DSM 23907 = CRBIP 24.76]TDG78346.1 hypothetical protein C5L33_000158 [Lactobacillus pasteurii]CCI85479.1 ORF107 [Lactobacillus pasteurii DSM 23907 = CRBIP 24.76]
MTVKDWLYLGIVVASYAITIVAGIYAKNKSKINKTTTAGKVIDVIGQLATYAVHEAEYTGMDGEDKRQYASEVVSQGLSWLGIKNVDAALINGAFEKSVNAMKLANNDLSVSPEPNYSAEIATTVPDSDVIKPTVGKKVTENA